MRILIPDFSLVLLIGPSGAGKSTFAEQHFHPTEVISSDSCRAMIVDDESHFEVNEDAFELLHLVASKRLTRRRLTVIDATNVEKSARASLVALARKFHCFVVAIVFDMPQALCWERNQRRRNRRVPRHAIRNQIRQMRSSLHGLKKEKIRYVYRLRTAEEANSATVERQRLWTDRRDETGPFDVIGDIHGCFDELVQLLDKLGYDLQKDSTGPAGKAHSGAVIGALAPAGRKALFLGDLVDRGPRSPDVLRLVMRMVASGQALCVPGNHDVKLLKKLRGEQVKLRYGLEETWRQLAAQTDAFRHQVAEFIDSLVSHFVLDQGRLVVAHAGLREELQGRSSGAVRSFALYGETTGETDEFGLPVRHNWAAEYRGQAMVLYGHTPIPEVEWLNGTACLDTGCVFGGRLTALRYPEKEMVSVPAARTYSPPARPLEKAGDLTAQQKADTDLDLEDVTGKRVITTSYFGHITLRPEQTASALEVMSRFAVDPRWLVYLPPTMAAPQTSRLPHLLEHPDPIFEEYAGWGARHVICQEKHMGSRCVVILCQDKNAARKRFGVPQGEAGICVTRTGRRFFDDVAVEIGFLQRLRKAVTGADLWQRLGTSWLVMDGELLPWSAKAGGLLERQYAPIGAAARSSLGQVLPLLEQARGRGVELEGLDQRMTQRRELVELYIEAYGRYCWPVASVDDLEFAPFHLLASEGRVHADKDHLWHLQRASELAEQGGKLVRTTRFRQVDLSDTGSREAATQWWTELTDEGGEGMVIKPVDFVARGKKGLMQPGIKCRGPEYLRIIYGPEYTREGQLERLRRRSLGRKRSLALREFALGLEALSRFVDQQPLRRVHECVFGVLALESEPVDPRL